MRKVLTGLIVGLSISALGAQAIIKSSGSGSSSITCADTLVIFADGANTPGCDAGFTYNKTTDTATLTGSMIAANIATGATANAILRASGTGGSTIQNTPGWTIDTSSYQTYLVTSGSAFKLFADTSNGGNGLYFAAATGMADATTILWNAGANAALTGNDLGLQRGAAGLLAVNGGAIATIGEYVSSGALTSVTNTTANSCGTDAAILGANSLNSAGFFTVGATAGTSCTLTFSVASPHGWNCDCQDETTGNLIRGIRITTTTAKCVGTMVAADVINYKCKPY